MILRGAFIAGKTHGRHDLPWQNTHDPYRIWLSEIMLQQTQVATVTPYYERFVAACPDVCTLAAAPLGEVLQLWSGLGYYRRAHMLHRAAQIVMAEHAGAFPMDARTLATLPGIGRSTAAAIAVFARGERGAILDGNVKRVLARHEGVNGFPGDAPVERLLWQRADALLPTRDIETYTQALMDLGATVCLRGEPRCAECPVAGDCIARLDNRLAELPAPRPKKILPRRAIGVLLIERHGGSCWSAAQRRASGRDCGVCPRSIPAPTQHNFAARASAPRFRYPIRCPRSSMALHISI
jgi:A/G-specific adenine glycosylase